ncbi:MAG: hypothetical protein AABX72_03270 [Nanoarchaeota archaeon]
MKQHIHLWYDQEGDFFEIGIGKPSPDYAEEIKPGIFVYFDEKTHDAKGVGILSITRQLSPLDVSLLDLHLSYDHNKDVLDVRFGRDTTSSLVDTGDSIFQRVEEKTGNIVGLRILRFTTRKKKFIDRQLSSPFEIPQAALPSMA